MPVALISQHLSPVLGWSETGILFEALVEVGYRIETTFGADLGDIHIV